jgi:hypothetical protein
MVAEIPRLGPIVMEHFNETAMATAEEPSSISAIRCSLGSCPLQLTMHTMSVNPMDQVSFHRDGPTTAARLLGCESVAISGRLACDDCVRFPVEIPAQCSVLRSSVSSSRL